MPNSPVLNHLKFDAKLSTTKATSTKCYESTNTSRNSSRWACWSTTCNNTSTSRWQKVHRKKCIPTRLSSMVILRDWYRSWVIRDLGLLDTHASRCWKKKCNSTLSVTGRGSWQIRSSLEWSRSKISLKTMLWIPSGDWSKRMFRPKWSLGTISLLALRLQWELVFLAGIRILW